MATVNIVLAPSGVRRTEVALRVAVRCGQDERRDAALCLDALLMLFKLLMAVFMEATRPRAVPTPASPPLRAPTTTPPASVPAPRARVPHTTVSAAPTPAPANTSRCSASCVRALWRRFSPTPPAYGRDFGAWTSSTSCSRRWCARRRSNRSTVRAATPRREHASRCPPLQVRPRHQAMSTCSSRRCSRSSGRPIDARTHRAHPLPGYAPLLRCAAPCDAAAPNGSTTPRAPPRHAGYARRRDQRCVSRITEFHSLAPGHSP